MWYSDWASIIFSANLYQFIPGLPTDVSSSVVLMKDGNLPGNQFRTFLIDCCGEMLKYRTVLVCINFWFCGICTFSSPTIKLPRYRTFHFFSPWTFFFRFTLLQAIYFSVAWDFQKYVGSSEKRKWNVKIVKRSNIVFPYPSISKCFAMPIWDRVILQYLGSVNFDYFKSAFCFGHHQRVQAYWNIHSFLDQNFHYWT